MDNSDLTQLLPDPPKAQPIMPALNADRQDISLGTVRAAAKDALERTLSISTMNLIPMKNWNLLIRLPKFATSSTQ